MYSACCVWVNMVGFSYLDEHSRGESPTNGGSALDVRLGEVVDYSGSWYTPWVDGCYIGCGQTENWWSDSELHSVCGKQTHPIYNQLN